jgi:hypothetical protein
MFRSRPLMIFAAALSAASLGTACAQLIGADFDVTLGSTTGSGGGSTATSTSTSTSSSSGAGGDAGPDTGPGSGGGGGAPVCDPMPCPEVVAKHQAYPWGIATQGDSVYWTNAGASFHAGGPPSADGSIGRASIASNDGVGSIAVSNLIGPDQIAADTSALYWTSNVPAVGKLFRAPFGTLIPEALAQGMDSPVGVAIGGPFVYWTTTGDGHLRWLTRSKPANPGAAPDGDVSGLSQPGLIAPRANGVYVTEYAMSGRVMSIGDNLSSDPIVQGLDHPTGVLSFDADVCYTTNAASGTVACVVASTHVVDFVVADGQSSPAGLATDGTSFYWANGTADGQIMRGTSGGAPPKAIASHQASPNGILVVGKWVYWTNHALDGSVMRTPK